MLHEVGSLDGRTLLSEAQEDYVKQIFLLGEDGKSVTTRSLAARLEVRPASVTGMVQRLALLGLVEHQRYRGVRLTDSGRRVALEMLRHHRLLETFLVERLGYGWDEVHGEAERLEHVISERFEERIAESLGHPTHDPHGDPIPMPDLSMPCAEGQRRLTDLGSGDRGSVVRVGTQDPDGLALLSRLGLVLGAEIEILASNAADIRVRVAGSARYLVPRSLADNIWLEEAPQ
jgi:DtxR family Mn-dependent transcriptional regulator